MKQLISIFFSPLKEGVRWNVCLKGCVICIISINSYISIGFSQDTINKTPLKYYEDSLKTYFNNIFYSKDDLEKKKLNQKIISIFENILTNDSSFTYPFDSLKLMGKLTSPDNMLRIYNWNLTYNDGTYEYFGFIQYYFKKEKKYLIFPLIDKSDEITTPEKASLNNFNWYGALYYQIILKKHTKKKYYTLLGWDGNNEFTNKKNIDVLYFNKNNEPCFGAQIFKIENLPATTFWQAGKKMKRVIFEFSSRLAMMLRYDDKLKMIVFDHLSPSKPSYEGKYQYYGPDFSYDGFMFEKGKWNYYPDIDVRNPKDKKVPKRKVIYE